MTRSVISNCGLLMLAVAACDDPVDPAEADLVVVEAFLFAGEPVRDVRLTATVLLGEDPALAPTIDDADVTLFKDGVAYVLTSVGGSGRYEYTGNDLVAAEGDQFRIEVAYFGRVAVGETIVPAPPVNVAVDGDTLFAPVINFGGGGGGGGGGRGGGGGGGINTEEAQLGVTWDNASELLHFVVVEGLEDGTEAIFPEQLLERLSRFRLITEPTTDTFFAINLLLLRDLGQHQVRLYRVNEEYSELYENRTQDSRDLNEPPSNIKNGLGIFSAFNSVTALFEVVRAEQ